MAHKQFSGRKLRESRIAAGIRPEALAIAVDRSSHAIASYELERAVPSVDVLVGLAETLGIEIGDLFVDVAEVPA